MSALEQLIAEWVKGGASELYGSKDAARELMDAVYGERYHGAEYHRNAYQQRVNLQKAASKASYAGWITAENPSSGPYQGTSLVWFPSPEENGGSVLALVIGTDGFGADAQLLSRPGHRRRLAALARLHHGQTWVKPDLLDLSTPIPASIKARWPAIDAALASYQNVIYAATPVTSQDDSERVQDLLDIFFAEHGTPITGKAKRRWEQREQAIAATTFPQVSEDDLLALLKTRRFVILEGPPGTGKTRMALRLAERIGSSTTIQFHPARTYEDFVVGLFPTPSQQGLAFEKRAGDLLRANQAAQTATNGHLLLIDEINRANLGGVLGESIYLFETGDETRSISLPYTPDGYNPDFQLHPRLYVLGTQNTADRSIARMDVAIRRRFAFVSVWPDLSVVQEHSTELAASLFQDTIETFSEYADDATLQLIPGHAYFLDPQPNAPENAKDLRVLHRLQYELLPLLRDYLDERMCGSATEAISGLADRVENRVLEELQRLQHHGD